jgi:hypothetical protein
VKHKLTHGGARSNAGRKASDKPAMQARTLRFTPDALKRLETLKNALGLSWPKLVERLVDAMAMVRMLPTAGHLDDCICLPCRLRREGGQQ